MLYNTISKLDRALIVIAVMAATLLQVLDITIVNVALPHMQGTLSATTDQITWVLTSYLVSSAIFMPLTGYFTERFGRKKYLLTSILGFVISSALCGAATSITEMVIFRLLQGVFGAALVPLSQAIMADLYPPEERAKAMAIWGMGVMIGPILGPTLGGYLTEIASWRWNFYINIPVGILSFLIIWQTMTETPLKQRRMDWLGLLFISVAIGSLQYFLDRGNRADWFSATDIKLAAFLTVFGLLGFIIHSHFEKNKSVFDLAIIKDRNFVICSSLLAIFGLGLFGGMVILPLMLENLFHYPVLTAGLMMAPRGMSAMVGMMIVGRLTTTVDPRKLITIGILFCVFGTYACTRYSLVLNTWWIIWPLFFQGLGLGIVFAALSAVVFSTLPDRLRTEAAGLFSLLRTLGSSMGISITITIFSRHTQMAWNQLGGYIQPYNPVLSHYLDKLHVSANSPVANALLGGVLSRQAQMVAFVDAYAFIAWSFVCMLPLVFLIKKSAKKNHNMSVISD